VWTTTEEEMTKHKRKEKRVLLTSALRVMFKEAFNTFTLLGSSKNLILK
jgi:hypothetical protein